jgi:hypothetical protein
MNVSGTGLSGSASFTANQSGNSTFTVTSNATNANTGSTIVARDASGNFSAGTITATLNGNASTATNATSATNSTTTSQRLFTGDIGTTGQGRFGGWYTGNASTGQAVEVGMSGGQGYVIVYNRDTSTYGTLNLQGPSSQIVLGSSIVNISSGALQQGGVQVALTNSANITTLTSTSANITTLTGTTFSDGAGNVRNIPSAGADKTSVYTLTTSDIGEYVGIGTGGGIDVPNGVFSTGNAISIFNNTTGNRTISLTITTAYIAGTDSDKASVTLATRGLATILFLSNSVCVISGNVT